jgi:hypothetical protein
MAKSPPIPKEQRSFRGPRTHIETAAHERHDTDPNLAERGQQANIRQNLTNQHKVQDR